LSFFFLPPLLLLLESFVHALSGQMCRGGKNLRTLETMVCVCVCVLAKVHKHLENSGNSIDFPLSPIVALSRSLFHSSSKPWQIFLCTQFSPSIARSLLTRYCVQKIREFNWKFTTTTTTTTRGFCISTWALNEVVNWRALSMVMGENLIDWLEIEVKFNFNQIHGEDERFWIF
jgi:hypothetical protein